MIDTFSLGRTEFEEQNFHPFHLNDFLLGTYHLKFALNDRNFFSNEQIMFHKFFKHTKSRKASQKYRF